MGVDIHGVVEGRLWGNESWARDAQWDVILGLHELRTGRGDQLSWHCLFGYSYLEDIVPLFDQRGVPADSPLRPDAEDPEDAGHSYSYATWAELAAVDWDEPCMEDGRAAFYHVEQWRRQPDGTLAYDGFARASTDVYDEAWDRFGKDNTAPYDWPEGAEVELGEYVYRPLVFTRRRLVFEDTGKWEPVLSVMRTLAGLHGDDNIRLVVYFC
ncbi:hypothetical protein OG883_29620 [Streptomyces sp. NBC_01142]|uniref:hypothetical protein n=1 Tax=Streptomyces sp. NBC_01142 TaxID=2975865 RepID=UPI0022504F2D|nr:hypothetical protein [Streptomyces sp. NBC_01142]MCX4823961.1 hypothetical protein [Streptomyces sp. NBC_01142]